MSLLDGAPRTNMHITFVKKILDDGSPCKKCQEVADRLESEGVLAHINHVVIADMRDAESEGVKLANQHEVERAPFFLLEEEGEVTVFDVYFKLRKYLQQRGLIQTSVNSL